MEKKNFYSGFKNNNMCIYNGKFLVNIVVVFFLVVEYKNGKSLEKPWLFYDDIFY